MKHKLFALLIVLSILLAACGGKATQAPGEATKAPESTKATAAPAESKPVEITFMAWGSPEELAVWQQLADDFHTANPNITVKMDVSDWDSYWTKLDTLFAGSTPPDVFAMDAPLYLDWQSRDVLLNLQPYVDATPGLLDGLYPQTLQAYKVDGNYYGMPRDFQTIVMFYNKDMFDAAGLAYPTADWTWDDVREMAKKLTLDKDGDGKTDQYGFSCDLWDMELCWSEAIWSYGGEVVSADFTKTLLGDEKARPAWQLFYDMIFTDKSMPDTIAAGEYGYDLFQAGLVALWPMGHWAVPGYATVEFQWDVAPMPKGPAGQATSVNSAGFVVAKASKNADASWKFIQFALSEAGQKRLTEQGLAIPVLKSVAESPVFLQAKVGEHTINQQIFLDSVAFARTKPVFKGYTLWADAIGNGMSTIWSGEAELGPTLDAAVVEADKVLAEEK
jgi:multiple sugar transport system substrate-binding protein